MRQRFAALVLVFMAFVGIGVLGAYAQSVGEVGSITPPDTSAPDISTPVTTSGSGTAAAGTYSEDFKQGMDQGLKMGFTMQSLLCAAQFNQTAAEEYNSKVNDFNQIIDQVFGSDATSDMYLQPLNMTALEEMYAAQQAASQTTP
jgi:hypothetical protein